MMQVLRVPPLLSCNIREGHQWLGPVQMDPEMESSTVTLGFPDKPKPWQYWPGGVNISEVLCMSGTYFGSLKTQGGAQFNFNFFFP